MLAVVVVWIGWYVVVECEDGSWVDWIEVLFVWCSEGMEGLKEELDTLIPLSV
jgi:hypothetical protein